MPSQISPPQRYHENKFVNLCTFIYVKVNAGAVSKSHMDEYPSICGMCVYLWVLWVYMYVFLFSVCALGVLVLKRNFVQFCILTSLHSITFQFIVIKFMLKISISSYCLERVIML